MDVRNWSGAAMRRGFGFLLSVSLAFLAFPTAAQTPEVGIAVGKSGLQVPRFVSLKAGRVNVRVGPGEDYKVAWIFTRPGLPIEVIQEYDTWRRVRDSDGAVGWVFNSLLSGRRTVVVSPWEAAARQQALHGDASAESAITAYLQPGVMGTVDKCRGGWCRIYGENYSGWMPEEQLWGVYPNEDID